MEAILSHRRAGRRGMGAVEYLIRWRGYDASEDTREPAGNLGNASEILEEYKKKQKLKLNWRRRPFICQYVRIVPLYFLLCCVIGPWVNQQCV